MNMRDPAIYRILHTHHTGRGINGASIRCTIMPIPFRMHWRESPIPCARWSLKTIAPCMSGWSNNLEFDPKPKQREFARLNMTNTVMSKRYLRELVETGLVDGWDDPRMPTLCGLRRRGYTPSSIHEFINRAGVAKTDSLVDSRLLEYCIRTELDSTALRRIAVTEPLKVTITNYPPIRWYILRLPTILWTLRPVPARWPLPTPSGLRKSDFTEVPPPKYQRAQTRRRGAPDEVPTSFAAMRSSRMRRARWWSCAAPPIWKPATTNPSMVARLRGPFTGFLRSCSRCRNHLYDNLFTLENVNDIPEDKTYKDYLNPNSEQVLKNASWRNASRTLSPESGISLCGWVISVWIQNIPAFSTALVTLKDSFAKNLEKK